MLRFGFELEGFFKHEEKILTPTANYPLDGFPGLIEIRTQGGSSLIDAYSGIIKGVLSLPDPSKFDSKTSEYKFSGEQMAWMRKNLTFEKRQMDVRNIYNKSPRRTGNRTLASLQINISNLLEGAWTQTVTIDGKSQTVNHSAVYGLLPIDRIVRNFDEEFKQEIKDSDRQPGMYAIKDNYRLEYRSLPNFVFPLGAYEADKFINRIEKCVKED